MTEELVERCARASRDARAIGSAVAKLSDCDRRIARAIIPIVLEEAAKAFEAKFGKLAWSRDQIEFIRSLSSPILTEEG